MSIFKTTSKIIILLLLINSLSSCGIYRKTDARKFPPEPEKRVQKNLDEGKGFRLFKNDNKNSGIFDFATSNELWRASLDTLDFIPLISADYGGGIIITDWYNENGDYQNFIKINIRFLTNEIRSDAMNVKVYTKTCKDLNNCIIDDENSEIKNKLISTILTKASRYKKEKDEQKKNN